MKSGGTSSHASNSIKLIDAGQHDSLHDAADEDQRHGRLEEDIDCQAEHGEDDAEDLHALLAGLFVSDWKMN